MKNESIFTFKKNGSNELKKFIANKDEFSDFYSANIEKMASKIRANGVYTNKSNCKI